MVELRAGPVTATVLGELGARLGSIRVGATELLVVGDDEDPIGWGGYVMAPWVGRIRDATFTHDATTVTLPTRLGGPHAAHGLVDTASWTRLDDGTDATRAAFGIDLAPPWPFGGRVIHELRLHPELLTATLTLTAGERSMPAELGWHPWFRTVGPITFAPTAMYERVDMLPTGRLVDPAPPPWDDCFVATGPVTFPVDDLVVSVDHDHDHLVVFDHLRDRGIAVEPQTGPPDAVHIRPRVLAAGDRLRDTMSIAWRPPPVTGR